MHIFDIELRLCHVLVDGKIDFSGFWTVFPTVIRLHLASLSSVMDLKVEDTHV